MMGYKGVGDDTKIHYSREVFGFNPICGSRGYRTSEKIELVTCKKCLEKLGKPLTLE